MKNLLDIFHSAVPNNRSSKNMEIIASDSPRCELDGSGKTRRLYLPPSFGENEAYIRAHEIAHSIFTRNRKRKGRSFQHAIEGVHNAVEDGMVSCGRMQRRFPHLNSIGHKIALSELEELNGINFNAIPPQFQPLIIQRILPILFRAFCLDMFHRLNKMGSYRESRYNDKDDVENVDAFPAVNLLTFLSSKTGKKEHDLYEILMDAFNYCRWCDFSSVRGDAYSYDHTADSLEQLLFTEESANNLRKEIEEESDREASAKEGAGNMAIITPSYNASCATRKAGRKNASSGKRVKTNQLYKLKLGCDISSLFRTKKRSQKGAVLIDASGSMGVNNEYLAELCSYMPAKTIAFYCRTGATPKGFNGHLFIYAKNGHRTDNIPYDLVNGGNNVDYPALLWLLEQEGEKTFISDEGFCGGKGDEDEMAHELLKNHPEILTIDSLHNAMEHYNANIA